jgi:hypothetical protein
MASGRESPDALRPGSRGLRATRHSPYGATVVRVTTGGKVVFDQEEGARRRDGRGRGRGRKRYSVAVAVFLTLYRPFRGTGADPELAPVSRRDV